MSSAADCLGRARRAHAPSERRSGHDRVERATNLIRVSASPRSPDQK
jgi:hypothetical protein